MPQIMVSVICTVYNHEAYLRKCLDGIVNQITSFDFEIIIHDDASTDNSAEIIKEYAERYPDIIHPIYEDENQHSLKISFLKDKMYSVARGKYIAYCEGDDYWIDMTKLQQQVDILEQHEEFSACTHNEFIVDRDGKNYPDNKQKFYRLEEDSILDKSYLYNLCKVAHTASFVFRFSMFTEMSRDCYDEYFENRANGDMKMSALFMATGKVYHIAKDMACYRLVTSGTDSWSSRNSKKNLCYETCIQLEGIHTFVNKYYGVDIDYHGYYKKRALNSIKILISKPSLENWNIAKKTIKLAKYSVKDFYNDIRRKMRHI